MTLRNKSISTTFAFALLLLVVNGCGKSDNPASNNSNTLKGTWTYTNYGSNNDTLYVNLNIDGSDYKMGGSGSVKYVQQSNGSLRKVENSGTIEGTYSDNGMVAKLDNFTFTGTKSGSNYVGTIVYIKTPPFTPDTLILNDVTLTAK